MDNSTVVTEVTYVFSFEITVVIGLLSSCMAVLTTVGNLLVMLVFATDQTIRHFSDYFILNLAVADFLIGCFCIPPYIPYMLTGVWSGGRVFCKIWLVLDYVTPATSTMAMCVISIDRYLSVAYAISYKAKQTNNLRLMMMLTPWILTFCVFCPAIVFWEMVSGVDDVPHTLCIIPYYNNLGYLLFGACVEFIIPLTIIIFMNFMLFLNVRRRSKVGIAGQSRTQTVFTVTTEARSIVDSSVPSNVPSTGNLLPVTTPTPKSNNDKMRRDIRVARSLFILVFIFVLCWMPFEIMSMVLSVAPNSISPIVFEVAFWILWINSTVNPILYPLVHQRIRKAFLKRLRKVCCCK